MIKDPDGPVVCATRVVLSDQEISGTDQFGGKIAWQL
jgi:hypothetical protein